MNNANHGFIPHGNQAATPHGGYIPRQAQAQHGGSGWIPNDPTVPNAHAQPTISPAAAITALAAQLRAQGTPEAREMVERLASLLAAAPTAAERTDLAQWVHALEARVTLLEAHVRGAKSDAAPEVTAEPPAEPAA